MIIFEGLARVALLREEIEDSHRWIAMVVEADSGQELSSSDIPAGVQLPVLGPGSARFGFVVTRDGVSNLWRQRSAAGRQPE